MIKKILLSLFFCLPLGLTVDAKVTTASFKAKSVLASDKWVKIGVEETGVYEISYKTLSAMGFTDPARVSIFGNGGAMQDINFTDLSSTPKFTDDLEQIAIFNDPESEKIYFYGKGVESIDFIANTTYKTTGGYYSKSSRNIYSHRGYYFLTDCMPTKDMTLFEPNTSTYYAQVANVVSYLYHEKDLYHNDSRSGQLFWGEFIGAPWNRGLEWDVEMPGAVPGASGVMQCDFYLQKYENVVPPGQVQYGFRDTEDFYSCPMSYSSSTYYQPFPNRLASVGIPGEKGKLFVNFTNDEGWSFDISNLDYWVLTYQRNKPDMIDANGRALAQDRFAIPTISNYSGGRFVLDNPASFEVFDITKGRTNRRIKIDSDGTVRINRTVQTPEIIIIDKTRPQKQISCYDADFQPVANQNLHAMATEGADLVIITVPSLYEQAEKLADVHRNQQGIKVAVATTEQCYNEFSSGTPDPMAYRTFIKMLHVSPLPPKNVILMGPLYADFRGVEIEKDPMEGIIAYQSNTQSREHGAYNVNDFYGMMDDYLPNTYIERQRVSLGVGILPFKFPSEAEIYVKKVSDYINRTDFAYHLNKMLNIGGLGDKHAHDQQTKEYQAFIQTLDRNANISTPLSIDSYGNEEAQKRMFSVLDEGCSFMTYFGHGAEAFLGLNNYFFDAGDVFALRNEFPTLAGFGGCQITNTDRGLRGLGETIVISTPYGCIGAIVSSRETWSGQNMEFFKLLGRLMYNENAKTSSAPLYYPRTIGETYAKVKDNSDYSNELAYQFVGDPAIIVPGINRSITVATENISAVAGNTVALAGYVENEDGSCDESFEGEVVIRLMEPTRELLCGKIQSGEDPAGLTFSYNDTQVAMAVGKVTKGRFSVELAVPASTALFAGSEGNIHFCAYDPSTRTGAGIGKTLLYEAAAAGDITAEAADTQAPVIEQFDFVSDDCAINVTVSDNYALNLSNDPLAKGFFLFIDGKELPEAVRVQPAIDYDRKAYSRTIAINGLSYGEHTARVKVKDAAGNAAETEIAFLYNPAQPVYTLVHDVDSPSGTALFSFDGPAPSSARLIIMDSAGNRIWSGEFNSASMEWPLEDMQGRKVLPGHYKAYILETGNHTSKGHSATIDVPVI